jgi:DNA-binding HxlR family transcriptional regulator
MRLTTGISKKSLRQALVDMERHGIVRREVRRGATRRAEYALTPLGESLKLVVGTMYEWGLKQQARPRPAPLSPVRELTPRA